MVLSVRSINTWTDLDHVSDAADYVTPAPGTAAETNTGDWPASRRRLGEGPFGRSGKEQRYGGIPLSRALRR